MIVMAVLEKPCYYKICVLICLLFVVRSHIYISW